jgi:hypothetical protein
MTKYNGWTNYATWRVNLEMFDGIEPDDMGWEELELYELSLALKDYAVEAIEGSCASNSKDGDSLAVSYALAFIEGVNWHEIATHMLGAYADA